MTKGLAIILSVGLAATLSGCTGVDEQASKKKTAAQRKESEMKKKVTEPVGFDWAKGPCRGATQVKELIGLTAEEAAARLGPAESKDSFLMGERGDEFHVVLQNTYPLSKPANRKIPIQEWTWTKGKCRLTLWFHQEKGVWKTFENSRYPTDAEF